MKHTVVYGIGNFASKLVGFILIPLYTDEVFFSTADYGMLSLLDVTSQVLVAAMGLAFYAGLVRWYWDKEYAERQKSLFFTIMVMTAIAAVGMGMIVWGFRDSIIYDSEPGFTGFGVFRFIRNSGTGVGFVEIEESLHAVLCREYFEISYNIGDNRLFCRGLEERACRSV